MVVVRGRGEDAGWGGLVAARRRQGDAMGDGDFWPGWFLEKSRDLFITCDVLSLSDKSPRLAHAACALT